MVLYRHLCRQIDLSSALATSGTGFIHSDSGTAEFIADQTVIQQRTR
jgi:hypothetical protein